MRTFKNIDEYILLFPIEVQEKLLELRKAIHSQVQGLEEYIGYQMPAFRYRGKPFIYFAGYKKHIGVYPGAEGILNFEKDFKERKYKFSKGAVQFPITEDLPLDLISKMIQFKVREAEQKKS
ncbi:iron chaperone [Chryseobacterium sp. CBSDS_008]|uniref:iron chaperone n=1 Tax=Chryseobacterium sp. CBSDS_008 TaxID=3415265 RepID=UPI003CED3384